jgi:hypothetical protein
MLYVIVIVNKYLGGLKECYKMSLEIDEMDFEIESRVQIGYIEGFLTFCSV